MRYFIGKNGQQLGPFDARQVRDQLAAGAFSPDDLVWREGLADWVPLRAEFPPEDAPPSLPAQATAPAGNPFLAPAEAAAFAAPPALGGRFARLLAVILDTLAYLLVCGPGIVWMLITVADAERNGNPIETDQALLRVAGPLLLILVPLLVLLVYQVWMLTTRGQTVGKKLLNLRIVRTDGSRAGFVHAILLRSFVMQLICAIPIAGPIIGLIDPLMIFRSDRRCLHDLLADTIVVEA